MNKVLIDTHVWLWWMLEPNRLGAMTHALIGAKATEVCFSTVSSFEIATKYALGKLPIPQPPGIFVPSRLDRERFTVLEVTLEHSLKVSELPQVHRDPFDRLLIAQANVEGMPLVSADWQIERYPVTLVDARE